MLETDYSQDNTIQAREEKLSQIRGIAVRRLCRKECSESEIRNLLGERGATPSEAQTMTDELRESGYVDDQRFIRAMARTYASRGKGPIYFWSRLREKGVQLNLESAREIFFFELGRDEPDFIRQQIRKRCPGGIPEDPVERARIYRWLSGRGFSEKAIRDAIRISF